MVTDSLLVGAVLAVVAGAAGADVVADETALELPPELQAVAKMATAASVAPATPLRCNRMGVSSSSV
jgi:hypothetical protein